MTKAAPPMSLLAELTHRCPLQCPYCSNPLALDAKSGELTTDEWKRVMDEAVEMGVLQVHFSGGEPMARPDLPQLVAHAAAKGLYSNLITSGVLLNEASLGELAQAGLDHIQLSFQDIETESAEHIGGMKGAQAKKLAAVDLILREGMPLTLNFVIHRANVGNVQAMLDYAHRLGINRVEIAHTQYYGWGLLNRSALMPTRAQLDDVTAVVEAARVQFGNSLVIDYVTPDYYADRPKPCMGGWARRFFNVSPAGRVLPCHAAETIPNVVFPNVREASLADIWENAPLFTMFRGTAWMPEPCQGCALKEIDWGGCRCQALALAGDASATDPVCERSPRHAEVTRALQELPEIAPPFIYRRLGGNGAAAEPEKVSE